MRYDPEHKARTRERIEATAAERFRAEGIDAVGVASLMESAGLTHGGFYAHFDSKDALVAAAIAHGAEQALAHLQKSMARHPALPKPVAFAKVYLSERHRDSAAEGCVAAALGAEIGRRDDATRAHFTAQLAAMLDCAAPERGTPAERRDAALATVSLAVGALILSRAVDDPKLSKQLLAAGVKASETLAG